MNTLRTTMLASAVLFGTALQASAQAPANDACANAATVMVGTNPYDSTGATDDGVDLDPMVCDLGFGNNSIFQDVWFSFTAPSTDLYDLEIVTNMTFDTRMAIYDQSSCPDDPALVLACDDDGGMSTRSLIDDVSLTGGSTYLVRCGTFGATTGIVPADLVISIQAPPPAVPNDDCANATVAVLGANPFDNAAATDGAGLPLDDMVCDMGTFGDEQIYADVWFSFSPGVSGAYDFEMFGNGSFDSRIAVYDQAGCPDDPANVIACNDDLNGLEAGVLDVPVSAGSTYLVRCGNFSATTTGGPGDLVIGAPDPPANDDCGNASVAMVGANPWDNTFATDGAGLPLDEMVCDMGTFGDEQIYQDVWFSFTAPSTDAFDIELLANDGAHDSRVAVYDQASCPDDPALVIACNDDLNGLQAGVLAVPLTGGSTYLVRCGNFSATTSGEANDLVITAAGPPPMPPANDDCANAAVAMVGSNLFDNELATDGAGLALDEMVCDMGTFGDEQIYGDVWFSFTAPNSKNYDFELLANDGSHDSRIAVYDQSSCPDDPALVIACNDDLNGLQAGVLAVPLTGGSTYLVRCGNFSATTSGEANDLVITEVPNFASFCFGDGLGTGCKCGNDDVMNPGTGGCLNSAGTGAVLATNGNTSVSANLLECSMTGGVPTALAVLTSANNALGGGNGILGLPESDGLRCVGGALLRHGARSLNAAGATATAWGAPLAGPPGGIIGGAGFAAGQTRNFQVRYRDLTTASCGFGTNTSQAISMTFKP